MLGLLFDQPLVFYSLPWIQDILASLGLVHTFLDLALIAALEASQTPFSDASNSLWSHDYRWECHPGKR